MEKWPIILQLEVCAGSHEGERGQRVADGVLLVRCGGRGLAQAAARAGAQADHGGLVRISAAL